MSNPRKFSEKIQIQLQKQEEETRIFNEMMQESQLVKTLCGQSPIQNQFHHHHPHASQPHHVSRSQHLVPAFPPYPRGGSLPNVNVMANQPAGIDLQNALENLEMLRTDRDPSPRGVRHPSPIPGGHSNQRRHFPTQKRPMAMEYEGRMPYLSPPENPHLTKRAHSDSAIHQSANQHHNVDGSSQQSLLGSFTPTRRSPVPPEKLVDPQYNLFGGDHSKLMQNQQNRSKSISPYPEQQQQQQHHHHHQQQQQQQQQHLLSPTNPQSLPITNPNTGSLPDLTNPAVNFQTLVTPLDPEDVQGYTQQSTSNQMYNMPNQIRAPNSHSPSTSPQNSRRGANSNSVRKSPHPVPGQYNVTSQQQQQQQSGNNHSGYNPYNQNHLSQSFNSYRSNSSSPGVPDLNSILGSSNPSSPGNAQLLSYSQDPHFINMHETVQHKFEQITMDQGGLQSLHSNQDPYMNNFFTAFGDYMNRNQANELGQIPDIIFTGADDPSGLKSDYSNFLPATSVSSSMNSHPFHSSGSSDPFASQSVNQDQVDLFEVLKLDQYDLGMLSDENLRNMVDPETEEQFRLDSNGQ